MLKLHDKSCKHKGGSVPFQESARLKIHFAKFRGQYQGQGTLPSFKVPFSIVAFKRRDHCQSWHWVWGWWNYVGWHHVIICLTGILSSCDILQLSICGDTSCDQHTARILLPFSAPTFLDNAPDGLQLLWSAIFVVSFFCHKLELSGLECRFRLFTLKNFTKSWC